MKEIQKVLDKGSIIVYNHVAKEIMCKCMQGEYMEVYIWNILKVTLL